VTAIDVLFQIRREMRKEEMNECYLTKENRRNELGNNDTVIGGKGLWIDQKRYRDCLIGAVDKIFIDQKENEKRRNE
jgi:hypothetical protein